MAKPETQVPKQKKIQKAASLTREMNRTFPLLHLQTHNPYNPYLGSVKLKPTAPL